MKNIGFIGCGNMAQAMIGGILKAGIVDASHVMVSNPTEGKLLSVKEKHNIAVTVNNKEIAAFADILVLSVKPIKYREVIDEIKTSIKENVIIITIAPGLAIDFIQNSFKREVKVVRSMPNTPAMVGEGMSAVCFSNNLTNAEKEEAVKFFESFGKAEVIEERLMDAVPAVSGSSPAYVYMFIEALADGAVLDGIPRDKAYRMAAQAVLGSAKMVLETGKHPGELKDNVCSPGGTTIEAVYTLEKNNFRGTVISAMESCTEKTRKMSEK